ncbi:MAG: GNVR domain-containing protein [Candidatus Izemoplasmataceae bacterium]
MFAIQGFSAEYQGSDNIEILDLAKVSTAPSGPYRMLYMAIGIVLGGMIGVSSVLTRVQKRDHHYFNYYYYEEYTE